MARIFSLKTLKKATKGLKKRFKKSTGICRTKRQKPQSESSLSKKFKLVDKIMMQNPLATSSYAGCLDGSFLKTKQESQETPNKVNLYLTGDVAE